METKGQIKEPVGNNRSATQKHSGEWGQTSGYEARPLVSTIAHCCQRLGK